MHCTSHMGCESMRTMSYLTSGAEHDLGCTVLRSCWGAQIEDAFYFLPSPYPEGQTVGAVRHTSAILDKATGQEVPLSEVARPV